MDSDKLTTPSSIDIMDGILRPLLGSMQATSTAVAIWRALRNAGLLNEELLPAMDSRTTTTRSNPAWHRGYDEGAASADQELAVCAPPEEYDGEAATEFMAGFWTGLKHGRGALQ